MLWHACFKIQYMLSSPHPPTVTVDESHCYICKNEVKWSENGIQCDKCDMWVHTKCEKIPDHLYEEYNLNEEKEFLCKKCRNCSKCNLTIARNHRKLECSICQKFIHKNCSKLNDRQFNYAKKNEVEFECITCFAKKFPFSDLTDNMFNIFIKNGVLNSNDIEVNFTPN